MEYYAGIDVSLKDSSVCVVDATGRIVREVKVLSEPEALVACFRGLGLAVARIGLEAGPLSQWLHAGLSEAGFEAVLLETRHVKAALSAMTVKTDRKDARGIAQLLRMGWFRPVHRKSPDAQETRALLVGRKLLQSKLRDVELSIHGILRGFGLKVGEVSKAKFAARIRELAAGHEMLEMACSDCGKPCIRRGKRAIAGYICPTSSRLIKLPLAAQLRPPAPDLWAFC
jgi:transposase